MQKVLSTMRKAIEKYKLIENGDKIAVGVSGGKDSLVMLKALKDFQKFGLYDYEIIAVNIDIYNGQEDYSGLQKFCDELDVKLHIEKTEISNIVFSANESASGSRLYAFWVIDEHAVIICLNTESRFTMSI